MKVTHTFEAVAKCPVNGRWDTYEGQAVMDRLMRVEDIMEAVDEFREKKIYQEELCQQLANKLKCEVTLRGQHSDVHTEVVCEPK